jgi:hypothetical protein
MFVAVGHDGVRLASDDGKDWKPAQAGKEGEVYRAVAFGNGVFATVGSYGGRNIMAATKDGATWSTASNDAKYSRYYRGLCFGDGHFLALGGDPGGVGVPSAFVSTSSDGMTWSDFQSISGKFILRRAAFGNGLFVGVGDRGRRAYSRDGLHWDDVAGVKPLDTLIDVAFGNGVFVGVGLHGLRRSTHDGVTWSEPVRGREGEHLNAIVWADNRFVAVAPGATFLSPDGRDWVRVPNTDAPLTFCHGRGMFLGARWKGRLLHSTDAVRWHEVQKCPQHVEAVAFGDFLDQSATQGPKVP